MDDQARMEFQSHITAARRWVALSVGVTAICVIYAVYLIFTQQNEGLKELAGPLLIALVSIGFQRRRLGAMERQVDLLKPQRG